MMRSRSLLLSLTLCAAGCAATLPPPAAAPPVPPGQVAGQQAALTASASSLAEYRKALEDSYSQLVARESRPVPGPRVHVDAAASVPVPRPLTSNRALS